MSELPLEDVPAAMGAVHEAASGQVVYITEHGERLAAIIPADLASELENLSPTARRELFEDLADAAIARESLAEPGDDIPAKQVWAEFDLA